MRNLRRPLVLSSLLLSLPMISSRALAQEAAPASAAPAAPAAASPAPAAEPAPAAAAPPPAAPKKPSGPSLGLSPDAPGQGGTALAPEASTAATEEAPTGEWKFDVTGYFRAPLRMSWGPPTTPSPTGGNAGTQYRTPPLVPDANYIDWRYTNSFVGPWTELNFHYGNDRVKSTVQIASYNLTDSGYRRLESNLGINEAFLTLSYPEFINENGRLTLLAGGFTNRYGAAGRYDAGKYETYLFGRTHIVGETLTLDYDVNDWTFEVEQGFGGKLEPIPFYGPPEGPGIPANMGNANEDLPVWEPYPGIVAQESTFVNHLHLGAVFKKELIIGVHYIDVFANDNERAGSYDNAMAGYQGRPATDPKPSIVITGFDAKLIGGVLGEGYLGYSHLSATNAMYIADAIEVLHSFGGWQLHDNYFGPPGTNQPVTGTIDSIEGQYSFSLGQYFHYPQAFWGDGPDLIATVFGMYNHVHSPEAPGGTTPLNPLAHTDGPGTGTGHINKLKFGGEVTYVPLPWLGVGGRFDSVRPDLDDGGQSFSVFSPRVIFRTAFVTHEQVMLQYSHYFYGSGFTPGSTLSGSQFPYTAQPGGAGLGVDKNAAQIAAIIWF